VALEPARGKSLLWSKLSLNI